MASPHHHRNLRCFGEIVGLNRPDTDDRATIDTDEDPTNDRSTIRNGPLAASSNVSEMPEMQQQLPSHPHHQGTEGGEPIRVRVDENRSTIRFLHHGESALHTSFDGRPDGTGTAGDAPPPTNDPTSSSASPNRVHASEGATELVEEPLVPLLGSQPSRPADQRQATGTLRCSINATSLRSIREHLREMRSICDSEEVSAVSLGEMIILHLEGIDSDLATGIARFGNANRLAAVNASVESTARAPNEANEPPSQGALAEVTNRPSGRKQASSGQSSRRCVGGASNSTTPPPTPPRRSKRVLAEH